MTYTRTLLESLLDTRLSKLMGEAEFITTFDGSNTDLNGALLFALLNMSYSVTDPTAIVDADVANVTEDDLLGILDFAEYRALLDIEGALVFVDIKVGHRQEEFSQLANRVQKKIARMLSTLMQVYGYTQGSLESGVIDLDLIQNKDDTIY